MKEIEGYSRYLITEEGEIYSTITNRFRKKQLDSDGYHHVNLSGDFNKKVKTLKVHRLVAYAFLGIPPKGKTMVNHKDGNKVNNHISNLEWVTPSENLKHAHKNGLKKTTRILGEKSGKAKLTEIDVLTIRELGKTTSCKEISLLYNMSKCNIYHILKRKGWKHV